MHRIVIYSLVAITLASTTVAGVRKKQWRHLGPAHLYWSNSSLAQQGATPMIVNGKDAPANVLPSMVSLQVLYDGEVFHVCGGTLASPNRVLTAAHCLDEVEKYPHQVALGYRSLSAGLKNPNSQVIKVDGGVRHLRYADRADGYHNDIAMLFLARAAAIVPGFVERQRYSILQTRPLVHTDAYLVGWGQLGKNKDGPDLLQLARYKVISAHQCDKYWGYTSYNPRRQVCALGQNNAGDCDGDSGGPLLNKNNVQIGVASWGSNDCDPSYPSIYASTGYYKQFIRFYM